EVAAFGEPVAVGGGAEPDDGDEGDDDEASTVADSGLRPEYPAIEIYRVDSRLGADASGEGPPRSATAPYTVESRDLPVVAGGPESLSRLDDLLAAGDTTGSPARVTRLLEADAREAGVDPSAGPGLRGHGGRVRPAGARPGAVVGGARDGVVVGVGLEPAGRGAARLLGGGGRRRRPGHELALRWRRVGVRGVARGRPARA